MHATPAFLSWTPADLVNHLWQSSVIAFALLLLMALCVRLSARTRLALGWMALAKFALPFGIFAAIITLLGGEPEYWAVSRLFPVPFELSTSSAAVLTVDPASVGTAILESANPAALAASAAVQGEAPGSQGLSAVLSLPQALALIWLAGCAGLYGWWIIGGLRLRRRLLAEATEVSPAMAAYLAAAATKAGVRQLPRCLSVPHGSGPGLLGVWAPILTLPPGLEEKLTPAELESVLLHELIHLQRRDPFWLAVHVAAVSALWFNPLAWLLSRWIRLETEKACDERVLELTGRPDTYAQGILKVVHLALGLPEPRLLSVITPPVVSRVKNILRHGSRPDRRWLRAAVLATGAFLLALGGHAGSPASAAVIPETESTAPNPPVWTSEPPGGGNRAPTVSGEPFTQRSGNWSFTPIGTTTGPTTLLAQSNPKPQAAGEFIQGWDGVTIFRGPITNALLDPGVKPLTAATPTTQAMAFQAGLDPSAIELLTKNIEAAKAELATLRQRYGEQHPRVQQQLATIGALESRSREVSTVMFAQATVPANPPAATRGRTLSENDTLSLNFPDDDIRGILRNVADLFALNIVLPDSLQGKTTVKLRDVTWRQIYQTVLAPSGHTFVEEGNLVKIVKVEPGPGTPARPRGEPVRSYTFNDATGGYKVSGFTSRPASAAATPTSAPVTTRGRDTLSIDFPDQDIRGILRSVADLFELNIIIPETLQGKTSVKLPDVTWRQIFKAVLDPADYTFLEEGKIIRIVRKPTVPPAVRTVMVTLDHAKASDLVASLSGMIDASSGGKLVIDARSNALVITETPAKLARLRELVSVLDRAAAQGVIETHIIQVARTDIRDQSVSSADLSQGARESAEPVKLPPVDSVGANDGGPAPTWGTYTSLDLDRIPSRLSQKRPGYPAALVEKGIEGSVTVGFIVDPVGNILNLRVLSSTDREFEQAALDAVKLWRFGPGKKGGRFVATNVSVVLKFLPPAAVKTSDTTQPTATFAAAVPATPTPAPLPLVEPSGPGMAAVFELKDLDQLPIATLQVPPNYPAAMKRQGIEASVEVGYIVDAEGLVQNARVISSSRREFEPAALQAVAKWKFKPGQKAGRAVATNMTIPLNFHLSGGPRPADTPPPAGSSTVTTEALPTPVAATPITPVQPVTPQVYALRELDTIPSPTLQVPPIYPADLKRAGVEGRANIAFVVDEKGQVQNVRASDSTDPRFEQAAINAVSRWKFKPGRKAGKPVATAMDVPINFHLGGR